MWFQNADFSKARIVVIGDLMLDQYWNGDTARISPEAPVPVVKINQVENRLGGAGNVANNIASLGANVTLLAYVGHDEEGDIIFKLLAEKNIGHDIIKLQDYPTIKKLRILSDTQQLIRLDREKCFDKIAQDELLKRFTKELSSCDIVVISDYAKGTIVDPQKFIQVARKHNIPVIVDPKHDFSLYSNSSVLTPNFKEFQNVVGKCATEREIAEKGRDLINTYKIDALVLTRSSEGMTVIPSDAPDIHLSSCSNEVYDVTGAGDTVVAAIAVSLSQKVKLVDAARFANLAASVVVGKIGTSTVTMSELQKNAFQSNYYLPKGVMQEEELIKIIKIAKAKGERIVFANGCYDIIHYGHIRYLEKAKSYGDLLIVGVNDDASVVKLKGKSRPINPVAHRMEVLAGLKAVDWVVSFSEKTPGRLVEALEPDVIVKSDEYYNSVDEIPETEGVAHVLAKGGNVYLIPRTTGISSSEIIQTEEVE